MIGGCELVLACDLRVGSRDSAYAITSSRIGTVAGAGGTQRLARIVGTAYALEILFAAEPFTAEDAYRMGLINCLTEKGGALAEANLCDASVAESGAGQARRSSRDANGYRFRIGARDLPGDYHLRHRRQAGRHLCVS
jgi:enoyl-CoA hydratase/carnithine racemase